MLRGVMAGGRWFDRQDLEQMISVKPPAAPHR
jgi:hypothetical protein